MKNHEILLALSDDAPHPTTIISALQEKSYQVTAVGRSDSAIEILNEKNFDLLVTDFFILLEKAKEVNPEVMVILMLDLSHLSIPTTNAIQFAADDYLFKPFELTELVMRVARCIEKSRVKQTRAQPEPSKSTLNEKILHMLKLMSHDIRGSLVSISATLKLLNRGRFGKMDEGVANRLKELFSRIVGLIGITEEYLERSFSVTDDFDTKVESLDLMKDILIPVLKEFSPELKGHHLLIDRPLQAMANKLIPIRTNRIWLKMVFRNLLKNAIKYGDKEGMITVGFEDQGPFYRLNVYNSGKPIPEEYRDKLFTQFMSNGNCENGKEEETGTGLGLYLIKKVIQRLGGGIWYEAKENGSNFVFTLPSKSGLPVSSLSIGAQLQMATADQ